MAEQVVSDLIMKFQLSDGSYVPGESRTELNLRKCPMSMDFKPGFMFEVQSFTIKTGLDPEDEDAKQEKVDRKRLKKDRERDEYLAKLHQHTNMPGNPPKATDTADTPKKNSTYEKWREGQDNVSYPVDIQPFEFTRAIDRASGILLQKCIDREVLKSATLIKRKAAGGKAAGEIFLRMDFTKVLLTRIDWDNEEPIKEKTQFVTRAITIHYLPQLPDGSLGAAKPAYWSMNPKEYPQVQLR